MLKLPPCCVAVVVSLLLLLLLLLLLCHALPPPQAEVEQQHRHIRVMIQQLQQQEQLMIADVRAAKVRACLTEVDRGVQVLRQGWRECDRGVAIPCENRSMAGGDMCKHGGHSTACMQGAKYCSTAI
jgi:hypothetical protein